MNKLVYESLFLIKSTLDRLTLYLENKLCKLKLKIFLIKKFKCPNSQKS